MNPQYPITPPEHPNGAQDLDLLPQQPPHPQQDNRTPVIKQEIVMEDPRNTTLSLDSVKGQHNYIPTLSEVSTYMYIYKFTIYIYYSLSQNAKLTVHSLSTLVTP